MLTEFRDVRQEANGRRRWFEGDGLELIVWYDQVGAIDGFQLCYERGARQWALTWRPLSGFSHAWVRTGDTSPLANRTPILEAGGMAAWEQLQTAFTTESQTLDAELRDFVAARLAARQ